MLARTRGTLGSGMAAQDFKRQAIPLIVAFALGIAVGGAFLRKTTLASDSDRRPLRQSELNSNAKYRFIDPLVVTKSVNHGNAPEYTALEESIGTFIKDEQQHGALETASIYFRDLPKSLKFIINRQEKYNPASLVKVPTMMSYFKLAETTPSILAHKVTFKGGTDSNAREYYRSSISLTAGAEYTTLELIDRMVRNSDNKAIELLIEHLEETKNQNTFNSMFEDLGLARLDGKSLVSDFTTINECAMFFRVLYNATYLTRQYSDTALEMLSRTDFVAGIAAGVPKDIVIAHKFGEFGLRGETGKVVKRELHDCGIVYLPRREYLLCVMTKGREFPRLAQTIAGVSQRVYDYLQQH